MCLNWDNHGRMMNILMMRMIDVVEKTATFVCSTLSESQSSFRLSFCDSFIGDLSFFLMDCLNKCRCNISYDTKRQLCIYITKRYY